MRSVTIIILHAFIMPGLAEEVEVNRTMTKSADSSTLTKKLADMSVQKAEGASFSKLTTSELADKVWDTMVERLFGVSSLNRANLDDTTLAKTHLDRGLGLSMTSFQTHALSPHAKSSLLASLPGDRAMKNLAISKIEAMNGRCLARDVSMKAADTMQNEAPMSKDKIQEMAGVTAPMGFFDPMGISTNVPEGRLLFYREAELKHGRVCMLAVLGLLVGEFHAFIPILGNGVDADAAAYLLGTPYVQQVPLVAKFWPAVLLAVANEEFRRAKIIDQGFLTQSGDVAPGDYGWDPLGMKPKDAKGLKELQDKELNNGRLAMFAAAGIIAQEQVTGSNIFSR